MDNHVLALNMEDIWTEDRPPPSKAAAIIRYVPHVLKTNLKALLRRWSAWRRDAGQEVESTADTDGLTLFKKHLLEVFATSDDAIRQILYETSHWVDG